MRLNDFGWKQGDRNLNGTGTAEQAPVSEEARNYHIRQQIRSFMPGQTLQGKVVGINGREIQIQADGDMVFQARLDGDMSVDVGKIMTFEVQSRTGKLLALRPLFENMGTDANVLKALDMAGLPVNSITVAMTEGLMTEGMPIDKHTLQQFYKLTTAHPDTNPVSFVQLQKLGMEITPENLSQLESYKALEHQLIKGMADVIEELPMQFQAMVQQGNVDAAVQMYFDILQIATEEIIESVTESVTEAATESVTELATESVTESATESVTEEQPELLSATRPEIQTEEVPDRVKEEEAVEHQKAAITGSEEQRGAGRVQGTAISELLNAGEREELAVLLKSAGVDDSTVEAVLHGDKEGMAARELLQQIRTQVLAEDGSVSRMRRNFSEAGNIISCCVQN